MRHLFISDLHLSEQSTQLTDKFKTFLGQLTSSDKLYILGDFFNFWIGRDCMSDYQQQILEDLQKLKARGITVSLMVGNRDFLLEPELLKSYGIDYLDDPICLECNGLRILISHGDAWCTDNKSYQRFRTIIRSKFIMGLFRMLPHALRLSIANRLRRHSAKKVYDELEDISLDATDFEEHKADAIVHGHTHNPITQVFVDSKGHSVKRIALSDWGPKGNALILDKDKFEFTYF